MYIYVCTFVYNVSPVQTLATTSRCPIAYWHTIRLFVPFQVSSLNISIAFIIYLLLIYYWGMLFFFCYEYLLFVVQLSAFHLIFAIYVCFIFFAVFFSPLFLFSIFSGLFVILRSRYVYVAQLFIFFCFINV